MQKWKLEGKKRVRLFRSLALAGVILTVDLLFSSCTGTGKDSVTLTENGSAVLTDAQAQVTAAAAEETTEAAKEEESTKAQTQNSSEKICVDGRFFGGCGHKGCEPGDDPVRRRTAADPHQRGDPKL